MTYDGLSAIGIHVEEAQLATGNALPVLHEIAHALRRLRETGSATVIDLRAIPFGPGDEDRLLGVLGEGEVKAELSSLGMTHIRETRYHGVWVLDYRDGEDARIGLQVEVTDVPSLLRTPADDIADSSESLEAVLDMAKQQPSHQEGTS